ncbi:MAG TPA: hypothetical protein PKE69_25950, partial [Pyrinomonadaceae bacterium]|nr:hypothetical protein [Pyrinomonadaceae bacterium]
SVLGAYIRLSFEIENPYTFFLFFFNNVKKPVIVGTLLSNSLAVLLYGTERNLFLTRDFPR